ncbi:MAG: hypothetical protein GY746_10785 [Gammaproteobacteria bacterium]|nr:hypothetical protein [Gammaproteobacteria bacterium]
MRTDIRFKLVCSKCGNDLEADNDRSEMEYNSAFMAVSKMAIKPCSECYRKARQPLEMISNALKQIDT